MNNPLKLIGRWLERTIVDPVCTPYTVQYLKPSMDIAVPPLEVGILHHELVTELNELCTCHQDDK